MTHREPPSFGAPLPDEQDEPMPRTLDPNRRRDGHVPLRPIRLDREDRAEPPTNRPADGDQGLARYAPSARRTDAHREEFYQDGERRSGWRIALYAVLGIVVLTGAGLGIAATVFSPANLVRERMIVEVKARTGRDLAIGRTSGLSFFPNVAVSFDNVTLSQPPGIAGPPMIVADRLDVAVALRPLLSRDVRVGRLVLVRPAIDLRIDASGRRNWDFAAATPSGIATPARVRFAAAGEPDAAILPQAFRTFAATDPASSPPPQDTAGVGTSALIRGLELDDIRIQSGRVSWRDDRTGANETIEAIDLKVSLAGISAPLTIDGHGEWRAQPIAFEAQAAPAVALLAGRETKATFVARSGSATASYDGVFDPARDGRLDGAVVVKAPSIAEFLAATGRATPAAKALGGLDFEGRLIAAAGRFAVAGTKARFAGELITGDLALDTRGARPFYSGSLRFADLDLNRWQVLAEALQAIPVNATPVPVTAAPAASARTTPRSIEDLLTQPARGTPQVRGFTDRAGWSDTPISLAALNLADADLKIAFGRFAYRDVKTGAGRGSVALKDAAARITLDEVALYDGRARGAITLSGEGGATVGATIIVEGADLKPLLADAAQFDWLTGRGRVSIAVAGRGGSERQIIETLNGKSEIAITKGAIQGYDVSEMVAGLRQGRIPGFDRKPNAKTEFSELFATSNITNGVAQNQDMRLVSAQVNATGAGTINLAQRQLDYTIKAKVAGVGGAPGTAPVGTLELPVRIQGPWERPNARLDGQIALKNAGDVINAIAKSDQGRQIGNTVKDAIQGNPDAKAKARDLLRALVPK